MDDDPLKISKREFMQVGTVGALSAFTGTTAIDNLETDTKGFQAVAHLLGPEANRPEPGSEFFDNKIYYGYIYDASDAGIQYYKTQDMADWEVLMTDFRKYEDAFETPVIKNPTTKIQIASHFPYNPQRLRLRLNGAREFQEYGGSAVYTHNDHNHVLQPGAGDTVLLQSAERPSYSVQNEFKASFTWRVNQSLQTGDYVRIGLFDDTDGWYIEHNASHSDSQVDLVVLGNGSVITTQADKELANPVTYWSGLSLDSGWFDMVRSLWRETYSEDGKQFNPEIGRTSHGGIFGPTQPNVPLRYEVNAGSGTTGLELDAGSMAYLTLGDVPDRARPKGHDMVATVANTDTWEPVHAMRIDPDRDYTTVQLGRLEIHEYSENEDVEILYLAVAPEKTDVTAADFSTPTDTTAANSVIEHTDNISQFPDSTGTVVSTTQDPGGVQIGYSSLHTSGQGSGQTQSTGQEEVNEVFSADDYIVTAVYAENTAGTIDWEDVSLEFW